MISINKYIVIAGAGVIIALSTLLFFLNANQSKLHDENLLKQGRVEQMEKQIADEQIRSKVLLVSIDSVKKVLATQEASKTVIINNYEKTKSAVADLGTDASIRLLSDRLNGK